MNIRKTFLGILALAALLPAAAVQAQFSADGVFRGTVANNGPQLVLRLEGEEHHQRPGDDDSASGNSGGNGSHSAQVEVSVFDPARHEVAEAHGPLTNGAFSVTTRSGATITGTVAADGNSVTGNYTSAAVSGAYVATKLQSASNSHPAAGVYSGPATSGTATSTVSLTIDPTGFLTFVQDTGTTASPVLSGGLGTVTQTSTTAPITYSFRVTAPGATAASFTGTFSADGGALRGTFTDAANKTWTFTAVKAGLAARLINISTRGFVSTGQGQLIGGFVISGGAKRVLVTARGASLAAAGVSPALADTRVRLMSGGTEIANNSGWKTNANLPTILNLGFAQTLADTDSAVLTTLQPGPYTTIVTSADGTKTGIALVEVYEISWE